MAKIEWCQHRTLLNRPKSVVRMVADKARLWDHWTERSVQITFGMHRLFRR